MLLFTRAFTATTTKMRMSPRRVPNLGRANPLAQASIAAMSSTRTAAASTSTSPYPTTTFFQIAASPAVSLNNRGVWGHATSRFMSSSTMEDGTSIVDVCKAKIQEALEAEDVKVTGAYDDPNGSHISVEVVSSKFEGKRPVQRQQLVYKAIWKELQGPVHAVDAMVCKTPAEASS